MPCRTSTNPKKQLRPPPETHALLKRIRATVDAAKPGCVLLAEANGFPGEVAEYFGDDDERHTAFNFPLMPRLFMALRRGDRQPIADVLADTPPRPPVGCQKSVRASDLRG